MAKIVLEVDSIVTSAEVPMGASLYQFLSQAGVSLEPEALLFDGKRVLVARLEMAVRHQGAKLQTTIPSEYLREVRALTPELLLVNAER